MIKLKSLISEVVGWQRQAKKDYLFRQSKLNSSNTVPPFEAVWKELMRSERFQDEINDHSEHMEISLKDAELHLRKVQEEKYDEVVSEYEHLDGEPCWRNMILHESVDPSQLQQLGIYWAIQESAAEAHWGNYKDGYRWDCTYEAVIDLKNVDWPGTIFARMDWTGGDDEQEIRFLKNSPIMVRLVWVHDRKNPEEQTRKIFINNRRRT